VTFSFPELLEIEKKQAIPVRTAIVTSSGTDNTQREENRDRKKTVLD
jgi:hypothetical protein